MTRSQRLVHLMMVAAVFAAVVMVAGCGVSNKEILKAQELCRDHGGVGTIWALGDTGKVDVTCANGARIEARL